MGFRPWLSSGRRFAADGSLRNYLSVMLERFFSDGRQFDEPQVIDARFQAGQF